MAWSRNTRIPATEIQHFPPSYNRTTATGIGNAKPERKWAVYSTDSTMSSQVFPQLDSGLIKDLESQREEGANLFPIVEPGINVPGWFTSYVNELPVFLAFLGILFNLGADITNICAGAQMSPGLRSGLIIVAIAIAIVASSGALLTYFERKKRI